MTRSHHDSDSANRGRKRGTMNQRVWIGLLVAACALGTSACSSGNDASEDDDSSGGTGGAAGTGLGRSGTGGGSGTSVGTSGTGGSGASGSGGSSGSAGASPTNPAECPGSAPAEDAACMMDGLECAYGMTE